MTRPFQTRRPRQVRRLPGTERAVPGRKRALRPLAALPDAWVKPGWQQSQKRLGPHDPKRPLGKMPSSRATESPGLKKEPTPADPFSTCLPLPSQKRDAEHPVLRVGRHCLVAARDLGPSCKAVKSLWRQRHGPPAVNSPKWGKITWNCRPRSSAESPAVGRVGGSSSPGRTGRVCSPPPSCIYSFCRPGAIGTISCRSYKHLSGRRRQ